MKTTLTLFLISLFCLAAGIYCQYCQYTLKPEAEVIVPSMEDLKNQNITTSVSPVLVAVLRPTPAVDRETPGAVAAITQETKKWEAPPVDRVYPKNWITNDGKTTYKNVKVIEVTPDMVTIYHADGGGMIAINTLTSDIQKLLNYDSDESANAAEKRKAIDLQNAQQYIAEQNALGAQQQVAMAQTPTTAISHLPIGPTKAELKAKIAMLIQQANAADEAQHEKHIGSQTAILIDAGDSYRRQAAQLQAQLDQM